MLSILHVVGARPNFPKIAPIMAEMARYPDLFRQRLLHTGQHYDERMSAVFFRDLELPQPDLYLGVGSGSHAQQTARVMLAFEEALLQERPDWVFVVGDVNSTLACSLVCAKLGIKLAHVEAGLRSFDRTMPEEINRVVADQLADVLLTPSPDADANLVREGIAPKRIIRVGNVMIDSLVRALPIAEKSTILAQLGLKQHEYALVTLHRPSNVDNRIIFTGIWTALEILSRELPIVVPIHPRSHQQLANFGLEPPTTLDFQMIEPQGYLDFLQLTRNARLVLTDSGGLQEETTFLSVPCLTLRPNTERPITVSHGSNNIVGTQLEQIVEEARRVLHQPKIIRPPIEGWDGRAAVRIVEHFRGIALKASDYSKLYDQSG